jgi:4-hydroxy-2-oxoheptanedioate aldolase
VVRADLRRPDELSQSRAVYARSVPELRSRLLGAEQLVGSFLQLPLLPVCEVMAGCAGLDFLCVEGEHSGLSTSEIAAAVATLGLLKMPAVVRVAANDSAAIAFALDAGAEGVIVPRVESAQDAARASWAARYPPAGGRGVGPGRASGWGARTGDYVREAATRTLVGVQVETQLGSARIDEIAAVDGVDMIFVGPGDLALSLGIDPVAEGERLRNAIGQILVRANSAGKATGLFVSSPAEALAWLREGVSFLIVGSDLQLLGLAAQQSADALRQGREAATEAGQR